MGDKIFGGVHMNKMKKPGALARSHPTSGAGENRMERLCRRYHRLIESSDGKQQSKAEGQKESEDVYIYKFVLDGA